MKKKIFAVVFIMLLCLFAFSGWKLFGALNEYSEIQKEKERLEQYEPDDNNAVKNTKISKLISKYPDVIGWLKLKDSEISYPFVQTKNNSDYLYRTLDGKTLSSGTLFMDCRNNSDLSDFNSIIYGHNMLDGSMFSTLKDFAKNEKYWEKHKTGKIYLPEQTLSLEFFAIITVLDSDEIIYNFDYSDDVSKENFLVYIKDNAERWRDIDLQKSDCFISLSTCTAATGRYRYVLVGRIV